MIRVYFQTLYSLIFTIAIACSTLLVTTQHLLVKFSSSLSINKKSKPRLRQVLVCYKNKPWLRYDVSTRYRSLHWICIISVLLLSNFSQLEQYIYTFFCQIMSIESYPYFISLVWSSYICYMGQGDSLNLFIDLTIPFNYFINHAETFIYFIFYRFGLAQPDSFINLSAQLFFQSTR